MPSSAWATVGDYVTLVRGTTYKGSLVGEPGPALLGLGSIDPGGGFRIGGYKTYGGDCPPDLMLSPGDIYASLKGATKDGKMIGSVARVPETVPSGRLTQDTVKLVFRESRPGDEAYLYWLLRTPQYRDYCQGHAMGSAVVALSRRDFLSYPVPPLTHERKAAVVLFDAIEERIDVNRRMSETLEAMARALFKSWFVSAKNSPNWEEFGLNQIARFVNGLALQKYPAEAGRGLPVIKIAQLRSGNTTGSGLASEDIGADYVVDDEDVLFSWSGSLECRIWLGGRGALNQHLFKVTSDVYPKWFYFFWIHEHLDEFRHIAAGKATTMGHIQRHHLSDARVPVPPSDVIEAADRALGPMLKRLMTFGQESRTLTAIRDTLLPKLISGELRIRDAERVAAAAT